MQSRTLEKRVEILESAMEGLSGLPDRVEALGEQISQLRTEMRGECSAVRDEMRSGLAGLRDEMHGEFSAVREEIRAGDEESRRYMRVLHEEVIARFAMIAESTKPRLPRKKP